MKKPVYLTCIFIFLICSVQAGTPPRPLDGMSFSYGVYTDTLDVNYPYGGETTQMGHSLIQRWPQDHAPFPLVESQSTYVYGMYNYGLPISDTYNTWYYDTPYTETTPAYFTSTFDAFPCASGIYGAGYDWGDGSYMNYDIHYPPGMAYYPERYTFNSFMRGGGISELDIDYYSYYNGVYTDTLPQNWAITHPISGPFTETVCIQNAVVWEEGVSDVSEYTPTHAAAWLVDGETFVKIGRISNPEVDSTYSSPVVSLSSPDCDLPLFTSTYSLSANKRNHYYNSLGLWNYNGDRETWSFDYRDPDYGGELITATIHGFENPTRRYLFHYDTFEGQRYPTEMVDFDYENTLTRTVHIDYREHSWQYTPYCITSTLELQGHPSPPPVVFKSSFDDDLTSPVAMGSYQRWYFYPSGADFPYYSAGQESVEFLFLLDGDGNPLGHLNLGGWEPTVSIYSYDCQARLSSVIKLDMNWSQYNPNNQLSSLIMMGPYEHGMCFSALKTDQWPDLYCFQYNQSGYNDVIIDALNGGVMSRVMGQCEPDGAVVPLVERSVSSWMSANGDLVPPRKGYPYTKPTPTPVPGDVDGDGQINLSDTYFVRDHIITRSPLEGDPLFRADANQDGKVDVSDIVWIINHFS